MEEALIKRVPPHDSESEKSVIGAMIMSPKALTLAVELLEREDFYEQPYGILFEAMRELSDGDTPVDVVTLQARLAEKNVPGEISDISFLRSILAAVPFASNVEHYARIVKEKSVFRKLIRAAEEIENDSYLEREKADVILDKAEHTVFSVLQQGAAADYVPIRDIVLDTLKNIEKAASAKSSITGLSSGFVDLDQKTSGFQNSDFVLIAARPSMGKTAFALNICEHLAFRENLPAALFSLEMSRDQLMNRLFALESHVNSQSIRTGRLRDEEWTRLVESAGVIGGSKLIIDDTPGITIRELRSKARKYKLDNDIRIIFIDYLQLMAGSSGSGISRQQEISDISRALKSLARELNIPIVALSQLNRSVEQRDDHRPMLSDLRESGAIEQDADVVMFLYRDDYYHKDTDRKNIAEVIIAKQRNGPIGTAELVWLPEYTKFANMNRRKQQQ